VILLIDNYDSFTYNLYQMLGAFEPDIRVVRNDALTLDELTGMRPDHLVLSPGPGYPQQAGMLLAIIGRFRHSLPILGICLGHQGLAQVLGCRIVEAPQPVHGKRTPVRLDPGCPLFAALPRELEVGRYHSLTVEPASIPEDLVVTARSQDGCIMGIQHRHLPLFGLQFHPESILTDGGGDMLRAFLAC
jgi:anthranilate synthase/aminodeoxychorismate synthase-like glutamine amidotransferase